MKRVTRTRLALEKQTLRTLETKQLDSVAGGISLVNCHTLASCPDTSYGQTCGSVHSRIPGC